MNYESKEQVKNLDNYQEFLKWYRKDDQELVQNEPSDSDDRHKYWLYMSWLAGRKSVQAVPEQEPVAYMTKDGRVSMAETVNTAMPRAAKESFYIPLYAKPFNTEKLQKENNELKDLLNIQTKRESLDARILQRS